ncbi:MAG: peroxiredoxin [Gemmatimonadales bacterium]|nr:MAG: peroxiredoxin [Gemmatimonadales bacterium]
MTPVRSGDTAPDFTLVHRVGEDPVTLSEERRKGPVVLLFFPLAFSPGCTDEICQVAEDHSRWLELDARVLGVSVDSPFVNDRFAKECGAEFPILSDFNREASTAWGVRNDDFFGMKGVSNRAAFVIDTEGTVRYAWVTEDASRLPDLEEIRTVVEGL